MKKKKSEGLFVPLIASAVIINALWCMASLIKINYYWYAFQYLPEYQIAVRYLMSWVGRVIFLVGGIGLFYWSDVCRKAILGLCVINILTIPWKHPYMAFSYSLQYVGKDVSYANFVLHKLGVTQTDIITLCAIIVSVWDIIFNAVIIFCLTRQKTKKLFR